MSTAEAREQSKLRSRALASVSGRRGPAVCHSGASDSGSGVLSLDIRDHWSGSAGERNAWASSTVGAGDPLGDPVEDDVESEHEVFVGVVALLVEGASFDHRGDRRVVMAVE